VSRCNCPPRRRTLADFAAANLHRLCVRADRAKPTEAAERGGGLAARQSGSAVRFVRIVFIVFTGASATILQPGYCDAMVRDGVAP
jgi:hypothetical protein